MPAQTTSCKPSCRWGWKALAHRHNASVGDFWLCHNTAGSVGSSLSTATCVSPWKVQHYVKLVTNDMKLIFQFEEIRKILTCVRHAYPPRPTKVPLGSAVGGRTDVAPDRDSDTQSSRNEWEGPGTATDHGRPKSAYSTCHQILGSRMAPSRCRTLADCSADLGRSSPQLYHERCPGRCDNCTTSLRMQDMSAYRGNPMPAPNSSP